MLLLLRGMVVAGWCPSSPPSWEDLSSDLQTWSRIAASCFVKVCPPGSNVNLWESWKKAKELVWAFGENLIVWSCHFCLSFVFGNFSQCFPFDGCMCPLILLCFLKFPLVVTFPLGIIPLGDDSNFKRARGLCSHTTSNGEIWVILWTTPLYACSKGKRILIPRIVGVPHDFVKYGRKSYAFKFWSSIHHVWK